MNITEPGSHRRQFNLAIFASGAGTNAKKIVEHFKESNKLPGSLIVNVGLIVSNSPMAGVVQWATMENIPVLLIEKEKFYSDGYLQDLKDHHIDLIVLAGFLWKVPDQIIKNYPQKIINIHPALLPKYGGKKMYGNHVHQSVLDAGESESGITIHYVDELYDHGAIIFQEKCNVDKTDTIETLSKKIHSLEHKHF